MSNKRKIWYLYSLTIVLLCLLCEKNPCHSQRGSDKGGLYYRTFADTIKRENPFLAIKINPFQFVFNEIPVSIEYIFNQKSSLQFQVGYIFPSARGSFPRKLFEEIGTGGTTTDIHVLNYRRSPYNNHGLSFKLELRGTGKNLYYAPQIMYKHTYYNEEIFQIFSSVPLNQTESKTSDIFGFGFMMGRQSYEEFLVFEWYGGFGLRINFTSFTVLKVENPYTPGHPLSSEPRNEDLMWVYPFLNFGLRVGIKLGGN
jgi:hypothetical protein